MAGGRPRKAQATSRRKISKEEKKQKSEAEGKLKLGRDDLVPPKWLHKEGKTEFKRVVEESEKIGIIDNLDFSILAMYCQAYQAYIEATRQLNKDGTVLSKVDGFGNNLLYNHPALAAQEKYSKVMLQCSGKLGLAATDRLKLVAPAKEEKKEADPFIEIIEMRKKQA